jgi:hypothetical protein
VHDNTFINYGEPLPLGEKAENMSNITFESGDAWSSNKTGKYKGLEYCNSSNNIWIKDGELSEELNLISSVAQATFNVKDYGALGNGVTDDGVAIQDALDACNEAGGGIVFFPKGTYCISKSVFYYSN